MPSPSLESAQPLSSVNQLVAFFADAGKTVPKFRVGLEQEKIPVLSDGSPPPYVGPQGIAELLVRLERRGFTAQREGDVTTALERNRDRITLEPGGQVELSASVVSAAVQCRAQVLAHVAEVSELARPLGIRFIQGGFRPWGELSDVPWLPKRRYAVMREFLPRKGGLALDMMKRTATVQANFDFSDEPDALDRMRVAMAVTSIVTALMAASPITAGRANGYRSYRAAVWLDTDEQRCGLLPFVFEPGTGFRDYVEWALDVPMFFIVRDGVYHPSGDITFRRFLHEGWREERATMDDWETHLSTLFPEVRLKRYVEVRGADAGPLPFAWGMAALWRGLLDDPEARAAAFDLTRAASFADRLALRREVPRAGLAARFVGHPLAALAQELVRIADAGLSRLPSGESDRPLLQPLEHYARLGRCPADDMLDDFVRLRGDPAKLVDAWELRAD